MISLQSRKEPKFFKLSLAWVMLIFSLLLPPHAAHAGVANERGVATWHDPGPGDRRTAGTRPWVAGELIAAHRTLPLGSKVRVVNLTNQRSVIVEIRDRGPYMKGRIIDVSRRAAKDLGLLETGIAKVRLETVEEGLTSRG